ncbi:hypothetical protein Tco_0545788 [Tanacetum coccineum]
MAYLCLHFTRYHEELKLNTPYLEDLNTPYPRYSNKIFLKILNVVLTPRNFQYAVLTSTNMAYRPNSRHCGDRGACVEAFATQVEDGGLVMFGECGGDMLGERGGEGGRRVLCLQVSIIDIQCLLE